MLSFVPEVRGEKFPWISTGADPSFQNTWVHYTIITSYLWSADSRLSAVQTKEDMVPAPWGLQSENTTIEAHKTSSGDTVHSGTLMCLFFHK